MRASPGTCVHARIMWPKPQSFLGHRSSGGWTSQSVRMFDDMDHCACVDALKSGTNMGPANCLDLFPAKCYHANLGTRFAPGQMLQRAGF